MFWDIFLTCAYMPDMSDCLKNKSHGLGLRICLTHPRWRSSILFRNSISWECHPIPIWFCLVSIPASSRLDLFLSSFSKRLWWSALETCWLGAQPGAAAGGVQVIIPRWDLEGIDLHVFFGDSTYSFHGATATWCYMQFVFECVYTCICMYIYLYLYVYMHWCVCVC